MDGLAEVVKVAYKPDDNAYLERAFREYYKLPTSPKIEKTIYVEKDSYRAFIGKKMRSRTQFESAKPFSELDFDIAKLPFLVMYSQTIFKFPSSRAITLTERLREPNGLTESVELSDLDGKISTSVTFDRYTIAEAEVVARFLEEEKGKTI